MYDTQAISERIKELLKSTNRSAKNMLLSLDMGINALSEFAKGKQMSCISLAKIADYLDCSVDYLLGRTDIVSYKPAPASGELSEHERLVLEAYRNNTAMQSAVDKLLNVSANGISIAEDISETIRKIESVSKADINKK